LLFAQDASLFRRPCAQIHNVTCKMARDKEVRVLFDALLSALHTVSP
jgi:hypothetical protein